ncbi:cyclin-like protein [Infundibulicybe gibba]|nr:cyclin-like protein [Infundibulicybe gibba]
MSSNIPIRRSTRSTRGTTTINENALTRPSRVTTRSKAPALASGNESTTVASKPKVTSVPAQNLAVKRKREVLVEVTALSTNKTKTRPLVPSKGKEKSDTIVSTAKTSGQATRGAARRPASQIENMATVNSTRNIATTAQFTKGVRKEISIYPNPTTLCSAPTSNSSTLVDETETERVFKKRHMLENVVELIHDESQADADRVAEDLARLESELEPPRGQLWEDLDAEDWDDPVMVSEYVVEICEYLKDIEKSTCPKPGFIYIQADLDWDKRGILIDWLLQVHARFQLLPETLFLCVNLLDRFLQRKVVSLPKFQLVGIACLFIASKFEETLSPSVAEIAYLADGQYSVEEILKAERYILKTIDWDLRHPGPLGWLRRASKADDCEVTARTFAKYLLEIGCVEWRLVSTVPSLLSAAALWLSRLVLGRHEWVNPNLTHYSTYTEAELLPTATIMLNYILEPIQYDSLHRKWAQRRNFKSSSYLRAWALERWVEGTIVDLAGELAD